MIMYDVVTLKPWCSAAMSALTLSHLIILDTPNEWVQTS